MLQAPRGTRSQVRGRLIAGLGLLVVLLAAAPAQAKTDPLERYARGTWASMVAMTDEHTRAARRLRGQARHAQHADLPDQHRRLPVERGGGRAAGDHRPPRGGLAAAADDRDARDDGARQRRPVLQLVRHPRRLVSPTSPGGDTATPILSSVDNGWLATGLRDRGEPRARAAHARAGAVRLDGLRLLLPAGRQPDPLPLRALDRRGGAATTRPSPRAGSRPTSASSRAGSRSASTTGQPRVPRLLRLVLDRDEAARARRGSTSARPCSRARCRTRGCG